MTAPAPRFGVLTTSFPRWESDDAGVFVARLVSALGDAGANGVVLVPLDASEPLDEISGNFSVKRFRYTVFARGRLAFGAGIMPNIRRAPSTAFQIPGLLAGFVIAGFRARGAVDVFHANWAPAALGAWVLGILTGKRYLVTLRGEDIRLLNKAIFRWLLAPAMRGASAIVSVNKGFRDEIAAHYPALAEKTVTVSNGVEIALPPLEEIPGFLRESGIPADRKRLLFVGTVIPRKRIEMLIDALSSPDGSGFLLLVAGRETDEPYSKTLRDRAAALGVSDRILFLGAVPPTRIPHLLACAEYYLSASEFEGRPNALLEALAAGKPCLVSDIPAHREIVRDGRNGLLFESPDRLREHLRRLERDRAERERIGAEAIRSVAEFQWRKSAEEYLELARNALR